MFKRKTIFVISILIIFMILLLVYRGCEKDVKEAPSKTIAITCGVAPNKVNTPRLDTIYPIRQFAFATPEHVYQVNVVFEPEAKWEDGTILRVYFDDANSALRLKTLKVARIWCKYANIKFVSTLNESQSDIRIAFEQEGGYQSAIGKESNKGHNKYNISMYLQDLQFANELLFQRVVLHEFGHALGLLHELSNPDNDIVWNKKEAYKHFKNFYGWDVTEVQENVFKKADTSLHSEFDRSSIMIYDIPAELTKNKKAISAPNSLSDTDIENIRLYYPTHKK